MFSRELKQRFLKEEYKRIIEDIDSLARERETLPKAEYLNKLSELLEQKRVIKYRYLEIIGGL